MNLSGNIALGFCFWDLAAVIILLAVIVAFVFYRMKQKDLEKELEQRLAETNAQASLNMKKRK